MLELRGAPALSEFRLNKTLNKLQQVLPHVSAVYAEFTHFADLKAELSATELTVLQRILRYGPKADVREPSGESFLVIPRYEFLPSLICAFLLRGTNSHEYLDSGRNDHSHAHE